ncbi:MAG: FAD-binding oxidoreductase [Dehalococcoidia bacterium]
MNDLAQSLTALLGKERLFFDEETLARYATDGLRPTRGYLGLASLAPQPWAVARPTSTEEVAAVVKLAAAHRFPLVAYGGGSGLMGGAVALKPSIVINLTAMSRILAISPDDRTATVETGVILADLERELNRHGLILGHDPWSLPIATVGGAIATDGLGYRAFRYGSMGDQVLGLVVVLANGEVLATPAVPRRSTGPNLDRLFIGAEGCLGIITEATLRVFPQSEGRELMAYAFAHFEAGFEAVMDIFAVGLRPAMIDYGESYSPPDRKERRPPASPPYEEPTLYMAFEGVREEVKAQARRAAAICAQRDGRALGHQEVQRFWDTRHHVAERYARSRALQAGARAAPVIPGHPFDYVHVAIPASKVLEYRRACRAILERLHMDPVEYGIWCQPELFSMVMVRASPARPGAPREMATAIDQMLKLAQDMGGSMEYCHGVGVRLAHLMEQEHGSAGLAVLRAIKRALDPHNIMNPGKLAL